MVESEVGSIYSGGHAPLPQGFPDRRMVCVEERASPSPPYKCCLVNMVGIDNTVGRTNTVGIGNKDSF